MQPEWPEFAREFDRWGKRYTAVFGVAGLTGTADMLAAWAREWFIAGYSADELTAALDALCQAGGGSRWDHYGELTRLLRAGRAKTAPVGVWGGREPEADPDGPNWCLDCRGSGMVSDLPLPRDVIDGEWVSNYTCAVICDCRRGDAILEAYRERSFVGWRKESGEQLKRRAMTRLADYYRVVPQWLVEQVRERKAARRRSEAATRKADAAGGPVRRGVQLLGPAVRQVVEQAQEADADDDSGIPF